MNSLKTILSCCGHGIFNMLLRLLYILHNAKFIRYGTKALLLLLLLSGCRFYRTAVPIVDCFYLNPDKDLSAIGRVAIIELNNESSYPQITFDVTEALFQAMQKRQMFGLDIVRQSDPAWYGLQLGLDSGHQRQADVLGAPSTYTPAQLLAIHRALKCDAILIGTITGYQPYSHMGIGLRLKLIDLSDGQLLWALEQVWDSADKTTEYQIKKYFKSQLRSGFDPLREQLVVVSPLEFIRFVAYEVAKTM